VRKNILLSVVVVIALTISVALVRIIDARTTVAQKRVSDEPLYLKPATAKRLALGFNGLAADWYWMRSLQYVGGNLVAFEDTHPESFTLADIDLQLLPSLLRVSTALDPQFIAPYEYGAFVLPEVDSEEAIALVNTGIANNPNSWRLHQHLGYIYWKRKDYEKAAATYAAGAKLPGVPPWMAAMGARMKAEGGSRDAAREMYRHLYDSSNDPAVKEMVEKQLMRLDYLDQREAIRNVLNGYKTTDGRCASSWREVANQLRVLRLTLDPKTGAPLDPSATPYELIKNGCDVGLDINTKVPFK
jgi:tetratricopeptide (TPR) repeat protein